MGLISRIENRMAKPFEGIPSGPISPVQIAKKAEKQMDREILVGAGKQYAPTLYTVLINSDDDMRMQGYYPTLAGEIETRLEAHAEREGLVMDGHPLVRFIVDEQLKHGKFEIIAEMVAAPIVAQLRAEEMEYYGIEPRGQQVQPQPARPEDDYRDQVYGYESYYQDVDEPVVSEPQVKPPLPYVPEEEIDRSIDYGEFTFNSLDFDNNQGDANNDEPANEQNPAPREAPSTVAFVSGNRAEVPAHRAVRARLIDTTYQRVYDLAGSHVTIGRESGNDIVVQDINASRKHAELRLNERGIWVISDLGSMNGTRVNGVKVASQPLYPDDIVTIGKTEYRFALA